MRITNKEARDWYMKEAVEQMWSYRTLDRNISTLYYERMLASQVKEPVEAEMKEKTKVFQRDKLAFIKSPSVLEFLGLPGKAGYSEADLEGAIISHLQDFILELGKGFAFVERQQLIRTEAQDYYIDLVFYNYMLKCFVLFDLKIGKITHQDVGQMDMYVRMYDELKRSEGDGPTIGVVLCSETDSDIARYSILKGNEHLFATKYKLYLPTDDELRAEIEKSKADLRIQLGKYK
jgi:predicted nuclease of restriction endonuclease-like (RecB) superfamily